MIALGAQRYKHRIGMSACTYMRRCSGQELDQTGLGKKAQERSCWWGCSQCRKGLETQRQTAPAGRAPLPKKEFTKAPQYWKHVKSGQRNKTGSQAQGLANPRFGFYSNDSNLLKLVTRFGKRYSVALLGGYLLQFPLCYW